MSSGLAGTMAGSVVVACALGVSAGGGGGAGVDAADAIAAAASAAVVGWVDSSRAAGGGGGGISMASLNAFDSFGFSSAAFFSVAASGAVKIHKHLHGLHAAKNWH